MTPKNTAPQSTIAPPSREPEQSLYQWCRAALGIAQGTWSLLPGDASFRRYYRIAFPAHSYVAVYAPPAKENSRTFTKIARILHQAGIQVPLPIAADYQRGFLLLPDFGDRLLLEELNAASADLWYQKAMGTLLRMQRIPAHQCPDYDAALLYDEMELFREWFLQRLLGFQLEPSGQRLLEDTFRFLVEQALAQPQVFVHRDYHSRNLLVSGEQQLAVLDFQDARRGPLGYDLVSLLRDCYIAWPRRRVLEWTRAFLDLARQESPSPPPCDTEELLAWMDFSGLQRHLKVLGIFARLQLRDGKAQYLEDLPMVLRYVQLAAAQQPRLAGFHHWFQEQLLPAAARQPWYRALPSL